MDKTTVDIIITLIALFGVIGTAAFSFRSVYINWEKTKEIEHLKLFQALQLEYDKDLRTRRIESYKDLCQRMIPLAKYPMPETLSYADLEKLALSFRDWYFKAVGLVASETTRDHYFDLRDGLKIFLQKHANEWPVDENFMDNPTDLTEYLERNTNRPTPDEVVSIANCVLPEEMDVLPNKVASRVRTLGSILRTRMT